MSVGSVGVGVGVGVGTGCLVSLRRGSLYILPSSPLFSSTPSSSSSSSSSGFLILMKAFITKMETKTRSRRVD